MSEMSYQEYYNASMEEYSSMLEKYNAAVSSQRYCDILSSMPFEFLNATHLCEKLSLYEKLENKPRMFFNSFEEAKVFYKNLTSFKSKMSKLLEDATYVTETERLAKEINEFVLNNPYLGRALCVEYNNEIANIAERCLVEIPTYPSLLTKKFRWSFIESSILSLPIEDVKALAECKIIKSSDIDHISLSENVEGYHEKIAFLCDYLEHPQPVIASYELKLKGVTFPNDDGTSRQENLAELKRYIKENSLATVVLTAESYEYVPEVGAPEPAIKISWDGKCIGNIAKDVAAEINEKFVNPQFTAMLKNLSGGENNMSIGCTIQFSIVAPDFIKSKEEISEER